MTWLRRPWVRLAVVAVVVAAGLTTWWLSRDEPPMDEALLESVLPTINEQLPTTREVAYGGMLTGSDQPLPARWFCTTTPIEIQRQGTDIRVGLIANCGEYAHRDGALVSGSGSSGAMMVTVTGEPSAYRLAKVEWGRDGAAHEASIREMFTPAGAREALQAEQFGDTPDPTNQARQHFGLPSNAPVLPR
jgi:hypothetical protein